MDDCRRDPVPGISLSPRSLPTAQGTLGGWVELLSPLTDTWLPFLLLTQRMNTGSGLLPSPPPSSAAAAAAAAALRLILGACFLSSLLIVSICTVVSSNAQGQRTKQRGLLTLTSSVRFSLRLRRLRAISARLMDSSSAVKCFFAWTSGFGQDQLARTHYESREGERGDLISASTSR